MDFGKDCRWRTRGPTHQFGMEVDQEAGMSYSTRDTCLILAVAGLVFFTNLGGPRLWDRDEPRNAGCAAEMLAANDWVTPVFNAELRPHKPVLLYWFMMSAYAVFGVNEFAARFWSAAFGTGTLLITYGIGSRLFDRGAAFWSTMVLATTLMFGVASRAATPDAVLIFCTTLALGVYVQFAFPAGRTSASDESPGPYPAKWRHIALMFAVMGLAVLAKGPVGLVLPTAVIGMFLLIKRLPETAAPTTWAGRGLNLLRPFEPVHFLKTCWYMRPITAVAVALVVALPWYVWVHIRTQGAWTEGFFITHNLGRATTAMEGHNGGPWFYPLAILVGFFPWSIFWLPTLLDGAENLRQRSRWHNGYLFAMCWAGVYVGLFSIARTKLPSYITPCYPGLALLTGAFLDRWSRGEVTLRPVWIRLAFGSLLVVGLGAAIAVPLVANWILPGEEFLGGLGIILMMAAVFAWSRAEVGSPLGALKIMAIASVVLTTSVFGMASLRVDRHRKLEDLTAAVHAQDRAVRIISYACLEPSWVFYWQRPVQELFDPKLVARQLTDDAAGRETSIITTESKVDELRTLLGDTPLDIEQVPYFVEDEDLVVVRRRTASATPQTAHSTDENRVLR